MSNRQPWQSGPGWRPPVNQPPAAPNPPDIRPLHRRKRVWVGAAVLFLLGAGFASAGNGDTTENTSVAVRPAATVTATATATVAASPLPAPTVTVTRTATAKPTQRSTSGTVAHHAGGGSSSSGSVPGTATRHTGGSSGGSSSGSSSGGSGIPAGAMAQCNDGSISYSQHHQGTCSHHGGVAVWYR